MTNSFLYKYKSDYRGLKDMMNNRLWISKGGYQNDACDAKFSLNKNRLLAAGVPKDNLESLLLQIYGRMSRAFCGASFGLSCKNTRLWNYYANGFQGYCICYKRNKFEKRLDKASKNCFVGQKVQYNNFSVDMTSASIELIRTPSQQKVIMYHIPDSFGKGTFWKQEREFRYSINTSYFGNNVKGRKLTKLKSYSLYLGFRCKSEWMKEAIQYCQNNKIRCYVCRPDFFGDIRKIVLLKLC